MSQAIEVILFDLGGVLVELGPNPVPERALKPAQRFRLAEWFGSETAMAFETGAIDSEDFARRLIDELQLDCSSAELIEHFTAWPRALYPGVAKMLESLRARYRLAILTNTNALHWPRVVDEFELPRRVDAIFASHRLGLAKPAEAIFLKVCTALETKPQSILFIDDNERNVTAAAALGFQACFAHGFAELKRALESRGIETD